MIWDDSDNEEEDKEKEEKEKEEELKSEKSESEEESSEKKVTRILTQKEKIIDSLRSIYNSINSSIKNQSYKIISEKVEEFQKIIEKVLSNFKSQEIPAYFYEIFAMIENLANMPKEEQKKLNGENNNYFNNIKKMVMRIEKKMGDGYKDYLKNRKKDEKELEEDLNKIEEYREKKKEDEEIKNIKKKIKKKKDTDEKLDILDLYYKDKKENVDPIKRRLKWVKKEKTDEKKEKIDETQTTEDKKPKNVKATRNVSAIEKPQENITEADIKEELKQIFKQRGQNKYSLDNVERLEFLYTKTQNKLTQIEILSESTLQCFDNYSNQLSAFTSELWNKIYQDIEKMVELHDILNKEKNETNQKDVEKMNLSLQNDLSVRMKRLENELYK
jgi:hypothetical protein